NPLDDFANFGGYILNPILVRDAEALGIYRALGVDPVPDALKFGRVDLLKIVDLDDIPTPGAHHVPIAPGHVGDVLRVDMAIDSARRHSPTRSAVRKRARRRWPRSRSRGCAPAGSGCGRRAPRAIPGSTSTSRAAPTRRCGSRLTIRRRSSFAASSS